MPMPDTVGDLVSNQHTQYKEDNEGRRTWSGQHCLASEDGIGPSQEAHSLLSLGVCLPTGGKTNDSRRHHYARCGYSAQHDIVWEGLSRPRSVCKYLEHRAEVIGKRTGFFSNGVPGIGTSAFTGKDSGCSGMLRRFPDMMKCPMENVRKREGWLTHFETSQINPIRSVSVSPSPRMPPEQTLMPASRTAEIVSSRSS